MTTTLEQNELEQLYRIFEQTKTVYFIVRSVSKSGMSRKIDFFAIIDNTPLRLTYSFDKLLNGKGSRNLDGGMRVNGCGMDMGFHVVYSVSYRLFKNIDGSYSHDGAYKLQSRQL